MFMAVIGHFDFYISIAACTPKAEAYLRHFMLNLPRGYKLVDKTDVAWQLVLITPDFSPLHASDLRSDLRNKLWAGYHQIWKHMDSAWNGGTLISLDNGEINDGQSVFVQLVPENVTSKKESALLANLLLSLNKSWMLQTGALPVHASAVSYKNRGYLFTGPSGAGKTTIALLSMGISDSILHDEKIFVLPENGTYQLVGSPDYNRRRWPRDYQEKKEIPETGIPINPDHKVPLTAVFVLRQSTSDYLLPLSSRSLARALISGFLDVSKVLKTSVDTLHTIRSLCELARYIPGYELNFRKNSNFYKLIDKKFPA
ncbi:hypothetical protein GF407_11420 [candidate division KSB1 bacterium]|nr:hypothetical protein [candidate division KSB1 bacterium]